MTSRSSAANDVEALKSESPTANPSSKPFIRRILFFDQPLATFCPPRYPVKPDYAATRHERRANLCEPKRTANSSRRRPRAFAPRQAAPSKRNDHFRQTWGARGFTQLAYLKCIQCAVLRTARYLLCDQR
jgi:hypothetical protein